MKMHDILRQDPEIWDLFTRREEYQNPLRDQYDRFPYYASKDRDIFEQRASRYLVEHGHTPEYPEDAPFAVCLTHDIDSIYQSIPSKALATFRSIRNRDMTGAFRTLCQMRSKKIPLCNFSQIMDLEERYGARSTFFFMAVIP